MMQRSINYARILCDLNISEESVWETQETFKQTPLLCKALSSPVIAAEHKHRVIDRVFPREIGAFLKVMCAYQAMDCIPELFSAYRKILCAQKGILQAQLVCCRRPDQAQLEQIKGFLRRYYHKDGVELQVMETLEIIGGFVIRVGDREFDWSIRGRLQRLRMQMH